LGGSIGSWCGPFDKQTLWLTAKPQASVCQAAATKVYSDAAEDTSEGLTVELDPAQLSSLPAELIAPARYCAAGAAACSDVQASLRIESYTSGQGITGTWVVPLPAGAALHGRLDASWCNWTSCCRRIPKPSDWRATSRSKKCRFTKA